MRRFFIKKIEDFGGICPVAKVLIFQVFWEFRANRPSHPKNVRVRVGKVGCFIFPSAASQFFLFKNEKKRVVTSVSPIVKFFCRCWCPRQHQRQGTQKPEKN
jgi:hypothetical protein